MPGIPKHGAILAGGLVVLLIGGMALTSSSSTVTSMGAASTVINSSDDDDCDKSTVTASVTGNSSAWVDYAVNIANDESHGYDQTNRELNPDVDCSYLVWKALKEAGLDVGDTPFNTENMEEPLIKAGFTKHAWDGKDTSVLQAGDLDSKAGHVEIYAGDNKWVGAHQNENGGVTGGQPGDQTGHEVSVETYPTAGADTYWHYEGSSSNAGTETTASTTVASSNLSVVGWTNNDATAQFGGKEGPNNICASYATGQCTWWACMREHMIGNTTGGYWGNGEAWVRSATGYGWVGGLVAPGGIVSFTPGSTDTYADGSKSSLAHNSVAGHVAVIESVDTENKTFVTSEKGGGTEVYSYTYSYSPLPSNMSVAAPPGSSGDTAIGGSTSSASKTDTGSSVVTANCDVDDDSVVNASAEAAGTYDGDGYHATPEQAKAIAKQLLPQYFPDATDDDWEFLVWIWTKESDWQWNADNPTSEAYGIPQSLPGSKMASAGEDWHDNAGTQIKWGLQYIKDRYGSISAAKAFWEQHHWY